MRYNLRRSVAIKDINLSIKKTDKGTVVSAKTSAGVSPKGQDPSATKNTAGITSNTESGISIGPSGIAWKNERMKLSDLVEWPKNPRSLTDFQAGHIARSIVKYGFIDPLIINTDNIILGGHARKRVMIATSICSPDTMVDVRVPSRQLTVKEVEEVNIRLNQNTGSFDFDILANQFDEQELMDWGFAPVDFSVGEPKPHNMGDANQDHSFCPKCKRPY